MPNNSESTTDDFKHPDVNKPIPHQEVKVDLPEGLFLAPLLDSVDGKMSDITEGILSWNINSDRRVEIKNKAPFMYTANAFENCSVHHRFSAIASVLDYYFFWSSPEQHVNLFALQEVEDSILPNLTAYFKSRGLEVLVNKYNPTSMAFNFVFAYNPNTHRITKQSQIYLTLSGQPTENREQLSKPELFHQHLESEFEKSIQVIELEEIKEGYPSYNFTVLNNHFGLSNKHRLLAANMLCERLANITTPLIAVGDFNQFDETNPVAALLMPQIKLLQDCGFHWDSQSLHIKEPNGTFITFPYDIMRFLNATDIAEYDLIKAQFDVQQKKLNVSAADYQEQKIQFERVLQDIRQFFVGKITTHNIPLVSTALDGVFSRNLTVTHCDSAVFEKQPPFLVPMEPKPSASEIQRLAVEAYAKGDCLFPSDHLPILAKIAIPKPAQPNEMTQPIKNCTSLSVSSTESQNETEARIESTQESPGMMSTLGSAAVNGALYAALPEAIGDLFSIYGHVSDKRASEIKWFTGMSMMVLSGGWMGAAASWMTSKTLTQAGLSDSNARLAGNAVGFAVNTGKNLTTILGIASTTVQLASGRFGLWAEKRVAATVQNNFVYQQ